MSFVRAARAWQQSGIRQQEEQEREAEREREERESQIRQAALLAGLQQQGIVSNDENPTVRTPSAPGIPSMNMPTSRRLGDTGYSLDLTKTPEARERAKEIVAQRQREEMLRRRRALLQARGVPADQIDAIVDDDEVFQSYAKQQGPRNIDPLSPEGISAAVGRERQLAPVRAASRSSDEAGDTLPSRQAQFADQYVQASGGDPLKAMVEAARSGAQARRVGMTRAHYYAAAQRYRDAQTRLQRGGGNDLDAAIARILAPPKP